jgi:hypothetical protein
MGLRPFSVPGRRPELQEHRRAVPMGVYANIVDRRQFAQGPVLAEVPAKFGIGIEYAEVGLGENELDDLLEIIADSEEVETRHWIAR